VFARLLLGAVLDVHALPSSCSSNKGQAVMQCKHLWVLPAQAPALAVCETMRLPSTSSQLGGELLPLNRERQSYIHGCTIKLDAS
jgi:hypothetical protein